MCVCVCVCVCISTNPIACTFTVWELLSAGSSQRGQLYTAAPSGHRAGGGPRGWAVQSFLDLHLHLLDPSSEGGVNGWGGGRGGAKGGEEGGEEGGDLSINTTEIMCLQTVLKIGQDGVCACSMFWGWHSYPLIYVN